MPEEFTLTELAEMAGYTDAATLRQAYYRGSLRGRKREDGRLVSTVDNLQEYLASGATGTGTGKR